MTLRYWYSKDEKRRAGEAYTPSPQMALTVSICLMAGIFFCIQFAGAITIRSSAAATTTATTTQSAPPRNIELHIASNGLVLLRGAKVETVEADHIDVAVQWQSLAVVWRVRTKNAQVLGSDGEKTDAPLSIGQYVTVTGTLSRETEQPTIEGKYVRMTTLISDK